MGTVYEAHGDEGRVAIKVFHPHLVERRGFPRRVQREAAAGREVEHENVVRTFDCDLLVGPDGPVMFLVMEYVEGQTLRSLLDAGGPLPEPLLREIAAQIAAGLEAIHSKRIVHRDVKPENVLVTDDFRVRLMDLGIAKADDASTLTAEGQFAGSLHYASPEQFEGRDVGPSSDLYALGATLYVLATGAHPFRVEGAQAAMKAHLWQVPERVQTRRPEISPFFDELVASLLEKDPRLRCDGSAATVREALLGGESSAWWKGRAARAPGPSRAVEVPVRRESRLYGREDALATLADAWDRACAGAGGVVRLVGEAGIGKSRLAAELLARTAGPAAHGLYGGYAPGSDRSAIRAALAAHGGDAATSPAALAEALAGIAREKPTLLVLDDLHFAPASEASSVAALAHAATQGRVLVVLTSRPGLLPEWDEVLAGLGAPVVAPTRLRVEDVTRLLEDALQSRALAARLAPVVAERSDGVPLFVLETIRGLREQGYVRLESDGTYVQTRDVEGLEIPSSMRAILLARIAPLEREPAEAVDAAAVLGTTFDPRLVARMLDRSRVRVLQDLAHVERRTGALRAEGHLYRFDHHRFQEVIYERIPAGLREEYHALAADALVTEGRLEPAKAPGADAVVVARHHVRGSRPEAAEPWLRSALAHLREKGRSTESLDIADAALSRGDAFPPGLRASMQQRRRAALTELGRTEEASQASISMLQEAERSGEPRVLASAHMERAQDHARAGRTEEAERHARTAIGLYESCGEVGPPYVTALSNLGALLLDRSAFEEAMTHLLRVREVAKRLGAAGIESLVELNLSVAARALRRFDEGVEHGKAAVDLAARTNSPMREALARLSLASVLADAGRPLDAVPYAEAALTFARRAGMRAEEARSLAILARGALARGDAREAHDLARLATTLTPSLDRPDLDAEAELERGRSLVALGRLADGKASLEKALALALADGRGGVTALVAREALAQLGG